MPYSEKIKIAMLKRNIKTPKLAEKLDTTTANLYQKLKRDNFSDKELAEIAGALNCTFEGCFVMNDTGERI